MLGRAGATPAPTPRARQTQGGSAGRPLPPGMAPSSCSLLAVPGPVLAEDVLQAGQGSHLFYPRWEKG